LIDEGPFPPDGLSGSLQKTPRLTAWVFLFGRQP
jgi:hypothetical protein